MNKITRKITRPILTWAVTVFSKEGLLDHHTIDVLRCWMDGRELPDPPEYP